MRRELIGHGGQCQGADSLVSQWRTSGRSERVGLLAGCGKALDRTAVLSFSINQITHGAW